MALYEYRCDPDGTFDVTRPIGTAPASVQRPACNEFEAGLSTPCSIGAR